MSLADTLALLDDCHARATRMLAECPPRRHRSTDPPEFDGLGYATQPEIPTAPEGIEA